MYPHQQELQFLHHVRKEPIFRQHGNQNQMSQTREQRLQVVQEEMKTQGEDRNSLN